MEVFKILFRVGFLKLASYVEASIVNIISAVIYIMVQFFVWKSIMIYSNDIELSFYQMFSYIVYSQVIGYIYPYAIGKQLGQLIKSGDISYALLKPVSLLKQIIYENIGTSTYRFFFISIPILAMGFLMSNNNLYVMNLLLFCFFLVISYVIYIYIDMLFGLLQFYTSSSWGVNSLKYSIIMLCAGKILPLSIYPRWCQRILYLLPFKYLYDVPLQIIIGQQNNITVDMFVEAFLWLIIMFMLFTVMYGRALKKITIMGG